MTHLMLEYKYIIIIIQVINSTSVLLNYKLQTIYA